MKHLLHGYKILPRSKEKEREEEGTRDPRGEHVLHTHCNTGCQGVPFSIRSQGLNKKKVDAKLLKHPGQ